MERTELVALLGVTPEPTTGQVRQARRSLARRLHPDAAGQESTAMMAEINAAVDEWLTQIRSRRDAPTPAAPAATAASARPVQTVARVPLRISYAAATILLVVVVSIVVVALVGFSATSLATGALLGSGAAGAFATLVHRHERRAPPHA